MSVFILEEHIGELFSRLSYCNKMAFSFKCVLLLHCIIYTVYEPNLTFFAGKYSLSHISYVKDRFSHNLPLVSGLKLPYTVTALSRKCFREPPTTSCCCSGRRHSDTGRGGDPSPPPPDAGAA